MRTYKVGKLVEREELVDSVLLVLVDERHNRALEIR
jgi:hypothetical protein